VRELERGRERERKMKVNGCTEECVRVCVREIETLCVRKRDRLREKMGIERERERVCVCVW